MNQFAEGISGEPEFLKPSMTMFSNRLTSAFNIRLPIISAPMAFAAGGELAAAVSCAGGLGLIGGGYGDSAWLESQFDAASGENIGVGFITWSLAKTPSLLSQTLKRKPSAVMLSFGDPRPFADEIRRSGARIICQCQNIEHVRDAVDCGADVIVAQGSEAGGHGAQRGTFSFVPEVADYCKQHAPETLVLAAGGIADGRGLAAALMLGADGVLVGTRLWASKEAIVAERHHEAIIGATGDDTLRTNAVDIARQLPWPPGFTARVKRNAFTERWHGNEGALEQNIAEESLRYRQAFVEGDPNHTGVWFGEAAGLIDAIVPAETIIESIVEEAFGLLEGSDFRSKS